VPALTLILYGVTSSQTKGWDSGLVLGCLAGGAVVGVFWVWWELRVERPLLNLRLLAERKYALTMGIVAFFAFGAIGGMQLVQPILFQAPTTAPVGLGLEPATFGLISLTIAILGFVFAPLSGVVAKKTGAKRSMLLGMAITTVGLPCFFLFRESLPLILFVMLLASAGTTFALTAIPNMLAEVLPQENMSEGRGFSVVIRSLFQAVSVSVFSVALSSAVVPGTQLPEVGAFGLALGIGTVGTAIGLALVFLVRGGARSTQRSPETGAALAMAQD
jgi:hypothetical protein